MTTSEATITNYAWTFTKTFHRTPYPAISPSRPELSQAGRTVLVTGGNAGIGLAIAEAFLQASARKVIITGRREEATKQAAAQLGRKYPNAEAVGLVCDISDPKSVDDLWASLGKEGTTIDVLALNAVKVPNAKPLLENGIEAIWKDFDVNVRAQLQMAERLHGQKGKPVTGPRVLINVSTFAIHDHKIAGDKPSYGLTKSAAALAMQLIAQDTAPEELQVINLNPGGVLTQNARDAGFKEDSYQWNSRKLIAYESWLGNMLNRTQRIFLVNLQCGWHLRRLPSYTDVLCGPNGISMS
jgi:NAD(P)-dependent dehydrogenase (short-subunit alcohol dehydrogenase family)